MSSLHALLARQIKRHFGSLECLPPECRDFVRELDETYHEFDVDRGMLERALDISTEELMQTNAQMRASLEAFPDMFFRLDKEGHILESKTGSTVDLLTPLQELKGKPIQSLPQPAVAAKFSSAIGEIQRRASLVSIEYVLKTRSGEQHYEARFVPMPKQEIFVVIRNITERKLAETALRESMTRLQTVVTGAPVVLYSFDRQGTITLSEGRGLASLDLKPGEIVGQSILEIYRDQPEILANIRRALSGENFTTQIPFPGGLVFEASHTTLRDDAGNYAGTIGVLIDVTEREQAQNRLRESEQLLRKSQSVAAIGSYYFDVQTGQWISSPALDELFGISDGFPKTVAGWGQLVHPEDRDTMLQYLGNHVVAGRHRFDREYRIIRQNDQQERWVHGLGELEFDETGNTLRMIGTIQDITARKVAERALWIKDWAVESSLSAIALTDLEARLTYVNSSFLRLWGFEKPSEVLGRHAHEFAEAENVAGIKTILNQRGHWSGEITARRRDGSGFLAELSTTLIRDREGKPAGMMAAALDITDRRHNEKALVELKERLVATLNALPDLLFIVDREGRIIDYRAPSADKLYVKPEQFLGRKVAEVLPPEAAAIVTAAVSEAMVNGVSSVVSYRLEIRGVCEWYEMTAARQGPAEASDARVVVLARTVTERHEIEERLRQSEARLREAVILSGIGMFEHDHLTESIYWSPELRRIHGWSQAAPVALSEFTSCVHAEDRERVAEAVRRAHDPCGDGRFDVRYRFMHSDGSVRWLAARSQTVFDGSTRRPLRTAGAVLDITRDRQAAEALRESEERLRLALVAANQGLYDLNVQTGEAVVSPEYALMLGYDPNRFHETNELWRQRLHPDDQEPAYRAYSEYVAGRKSEYRIEFRQRTQGGEWKWILSHGKIVAKNAEGRPLRMVGTHTDITDRKRIEEALRLSVERFSFAMEAANDGLWDWHVPSNWSYFSPRYYTMLGYEPYEMEPGRQTWMNLIHPEDRAGIVRRFDDYVQGRAERYEEEFRMRHRSGRDVWVLSRGKVVLRDAHGQPLRVVGTHSDITARKLAEEKVIRSRDELEVRVQERTQQLEEAKVAAEAASEAKSRFLAMMSHEIRTPLNGVTGVLHLLQRQNLSAAQQRWIEMATNSSATLLNVINDILDFSKVEAGKLDLHIAPTDLPAIINETAGTFTEMAVAKGLVWSCFIEPRVPRHVAGDRVRLAQVLGNLLSNAIKFTDSGEVNLRVSLKSEARGIALVRFEVKDTGPGISPEEQECLFKPFSQVDNSTTRRHGGTGLGLGICKHLVQLMGGRIGVQSEANQGSTFWFEIPFNLSSTLPAAASESATEAVPGSAAPVAGLVLLAEDNEINQELAREMIRYAGCECECVADGAEAVKAAASGRYHLVFMDCMMPGMDGYSATRAIRAEEAKRASAGQQTRYLPIVALTANAMDGDREKCLAAGMDDYVSKPLMPEDVGRVLEKWLTSKSRQRMNPSAAALPVSSASETHHPTRE